MGIECYRADCFLVKCDELNIPEQQVHSVRNNFKRQGHVDNKLLINIVACNETIPYILELEKRVSKENGVIVQNGPITVTTLDNEGKPVLAEVFERCKFYGVTSEELNYNHQNVHSFVLHFGYFNRYFDCLLNQTK